MMGPSRGVFATVIVNFFSNRFLEVEPVNEILSGLTLEQLPVFLSQRARKISRRGRRVRRENAAPTGSTMVIVREWWPGLSLRSFRFLCDLCVRSPALSARPH